MVANPPDFARPLSGRNTRRSLREPPPDDHHQGHIRAPERLGPGLRSPCRDAESTISAHHWSSASRRSLLAAGLAATFAATVPTPAKASPGERGGHGHPKPGKWDHHLKSTPTSCTGAATRSAGRPASR